MKHYLIAFVMLLALGANAQIPQPRHRHHAPVEIADTTLKDAIEVYSDTTATDLAGSEDTTYTYVATDDDMVTESVFEHFMDNLVGGTIGAGGVIIAIIIILAILLCALAPFIIAILIIRYFINRHNNRVSLAQKAMETGQPIPEDMKPMVDESPEYYKKKGIKNIAIGVGLAIMFGIWDADMLAGIGILIACWGIGQLVIAKTTK